MNLNFSNVDELLQKAKYENLYEKLVLQLIKDFGLANIDLEIHENGAPQKLHELVREKIYYLLLEKFDMYLNLLYVIDVPEKEFKHINMTDAVEVADQITILILKRELQKVWFKTKYSS